MIEAFFKDFTGPNLEKDMGEYLNDYAKENNLRLISVSHVHELVEPRSGAFMGYRLLLVWDDNDEDNLRHDLERVYRREGRLREAFIQTQQMLEQIVHLKSTNFAEVQKRIIANRTALGETQ